MGKAMLVGFVENWERVEESDTVFRESERVLCESVMCICEGFGCQESYGREDELLS